jgi:hypothetical protein
MAYELPKRYYGECDCPGMTMTDRNKSYISSGYAELEDNIPMGRFCDPSDIADTAVFLASDRAKMITGQAIAVDGGGCSACPVAMGKVSKNGRPIAEEDQERERGKG